MRYEVNLFPVEVEEREFSILEPDIELGRELVNKTLYRLSSLYGACFFREGMFYVSGPVERDKVSLELGDGVFVSLTFRGTEITRPSGCQEVYQFLGKLLRDFCRKKDLRDIHTISGGIVLLDRIEHRCFDVKGKTCLLIDFSYSLIEKQTLKELLKKGAVSEKELRAYRYKPEGADVTFELTKILWNVSDEEKRKIKELSTSKVVRNYIDSIMGKQEPFLLLAGRYRYPAGVVRRSIGLNSLGDDVRTKVLRKVRMNSRNRKRRIRELARKLGTYLSSYSVILGKALEVGKVLDFHHEVIDSEGRTFSARRGTYRIIKEGAPFKGQKSLRMAVINTSGKWKELRRITREIVSFLEGKGFEIEQEYFELPGNSREEIKRNFYDLKIKPSDYDISLVFLKDFGRIDPFEEESLYEFFKDRFLREFVPTQMVREETARVWNKFTLYNVVEGIMGKTGNLPYKLARPLEGADLFIGLDIGRAKLSRSGKTLNASSVTKIFLNNGEFIKFSIDTDPVGGETFTSKIFDNLAGNIYRDFGKGVKVVIHRDGKFQGKEIETLLKFFRSYDLREPVLVEVIKSGNPRFFPNPPKGLSLLIDEDTAVVATYEVRDNMGSHMPVRLRRVYGDMDIETIARHVLSLTILNYGAISLAKLPATTYYPDRISYLALRGIMPPMREGNRMFWL